MNQRSFATAINCMDGRTQLPVMDYIKKKYRVEYVDMITEPGPIKILAENKDETMLNSIKRRVEISIGKHGSKYIAIAGHHDCVGNPVEKEMQLLQIFNSIKTVHSWGFRGEIIGLWIDENWNVHDVK
ncbi:MAG: carbonic anhydrase [Candidatus Bathyarchaeota archaeon]